MDRMSKFFQRRNIDGQQVHDKMLNITNHQRTQIKPSKRYHFIPVRMAIIQRDKT